MVSRTQSLGKIISEKKSELLILAKEMVASSSQDGSTEVDGGKYRLAGNRTLKVGDVTLTIGGVAIIGTQPKSTVFSNRAGKEEEKEYIELLINNWALVNAEAVYALDFSGVDASKIRLVRYGEATDRVVAMAMEMHVGIGENFRFFHIFKLNRSGDDTFVPVKFGATKSIGGQVFAVVDMVLEETIDIYASSIPIGTSITYACTHTFTYPHFSATAAIERYVTTDRQEHSGIFYFPPPRLWHGWDGPSAFPWYINSIHVSYSAPSWDEDVFNINRTFQLILNEEHINPDRKTLYASPLLQNPVRRWEGYHVALLDFAHRRIEEKNDMLLFVQFVLTGPPDKLEAVPPGGGQGWGPYLVQFYSEDPRAVAIGSSDWDDVHVAVCSTQKGMLWKDSESKTYTVSLKSLYAHPVGVVDWQASVSFVWWDIAEVTRLAALNPPLSIPALPPNESYSGTQRGIGGGGTLPLPAGDPNYTFTGGAFGSVNTGFLSSSVSVKEYSAVGPNALWLGDLGLVSYAIYNYTPVFVQRFHTCPYYASAVGKAAVEHHIVPGEESQKEFVMLYSIDLRRGSTITDKEWNMYYAPSGEALPPVRLSNHIRAATTAGAKAILPPVFYSAAEGGFSRFFYDPLVFSANVGLAVTNITGMDKVELFVVDLVSLDAGLGATRVFLSSGLLDFYFNLAPVLSMEGEEEYLIVNTSEQLDTDGITVLSPAMELVNLNMEIDPGTGSMTLLGTKEFLVVPPLGTTNARARRIS